MAFTGQATLPHCIGPGIRAANTHNDVHAFLERVDETVGEGNMRSQGRMILSKAQEDRQHLGAAKSPWQVYANAAPDLAGFGLECKLGLFQVGQHAGAGAIEGHSRVGKRHASCGPMQQASAQSALQARDAFTDGRACQVHFLGGGREAAGLGHADKYIDALQALGGKHRHSLFVNLAPCTR